jgi:hypothetical protein
VSKPDSGAWVPSPRISTQRAMQVSTHGSGDAAKALDGNINTALASGGCMHTGVAPRSEPGWPWLVVDTGVVPPSGQRLVSVTVTNRDDGVAGGWWEQLVGQALACTLAKGALGLLARHARQGKGGAGGAKEELN